MPINKKKIRREIVINGASVWITANTEQEYADKIIRLAGYHPYTPKTPTFREYADRWYYGVSKPNVREVTAITYLRQLTLHINPIIGDKKLDEIDSYAIQQIFNQLPADAKQDTKNKIKNVLNQIFKMAVEEDLIRRNPMTSTSLRIKGEASSATKPYSLAEMRYFASHLTDISDPTDRTWLILSICLPLRPEEVLGLKWSDLDISARTLTVHNTVTHPDRNRPVFKPYTKTSSSVRTLAISQKLLGYLPEPGNPDAFVIGGDQPLSYTQVRRMRLRIAKQISYDGEIVPRRFRTTVATDISSVTHDLKLVQAMLGHSTPQMTLKHYDKGRNTAVDAIQAIEQCYGF